MKYKRLTVTIVIFLSIYGYLKSLYFMRRYEISRKQLPLTNNSNRPLLNTSDNQHGTRQTDNCTEDLKRSRYILQNMKGGRTGNYLFQIYCLLSFSAKFCYTPVIDPKHNKKVKYFDPIFDLYHVEMNADVNSIAFKNLENLASVSSMQKLMDGNNNWAVSDRCSGYNYLLDQEQFVRMSVKLKKHFTREADKYLRAHFTNRSTVAIHIRRTDRLMRNSTTLRKNLDWYEPFINRAMIHLKNKHLHLSFIFISDDMKWCRKHFKGNGVHFSPFTDPGYDLALIGLCDNVILTIGTFGYHGAWLGNRKSVIYSNQYAPSIFYKRMFFLPYWTGI